MTELGRFERTGSRRRTLLIVASRLAAFLCLLGAISLAAALACPCAPALAASQLPGKTITASFSAGKPAPPRISSTAAILIDQKTGKILFSHNANARLPMASTTKIMTAVLVLEKLELDAEVKISANAVSTIGSKSSLQRGEVLTVEQLLYALMVVSGNDASIALAEATAGSVEAFVEMMNAKAAELGLTNTHFVNPCGLNNKRHFSSAKDLATLARYALRDPVFSRIVDTIYFSLPPVAPVPPATKETKRDFDNQNELLKRLAWVTGVKTGSTPYAKYCLVASGSFEGVSLVAVVLGAAEDETRWKEARSLLEYGVSLHPRTLLIDRGELVAEVDASDPLGRKVRLVAARPFVARLSETDVVTGTVTLDRTPKTPVNAGDFFGKMEFTVDGRRLGSVDLIAALPLERPPIHILIDRWEHLRPFLLRSAY
jgi:D-alanyl-D-alanine carboxypeptidase (penicillin-binding protein 5/6)